MGRWNKLYNYLLYLHVIFARFVLGRSTGSRKSGCRSEKPLTSQGSLIYSTAVRSFRGRMTPHRACGVHGLGRQGLPAHAASTHWELSHDMQAAHAARGSRARTRTGNHPRHRGRQKTSRAPDSPSRATLSSTQRRGAHQAEVNAPIRPAKRNRHNQRNRISR